MTEHKVELFEGDDFERRAQAAAEYRLEEAIERVEGSPVPPRVDVLNEAAELITGDRNEAYGSPTQNFTDTAAMWTVLLGHKLRPGEMVAPGEVAALMIALKLCRMKAQPKRDNWTDVIGYGGCGFEADLESGRIGASDG